MLLFQVKTPCGPLSGQEGFNPLKQINYFPGGHPELCLRYIPVRRSPLGYVFGKLALEILPTTPVWLG